MSASYLIRFDDICPTMKWDTWFRIEEMLVRHGVKPILAVVPDNRDPELVVDAHRDDFWDHVRRWRDMGWTIALHGYQHHYVTTDSGLMGINNYSEFAGLPLSVQRDKIGAGVEIFAREGIHSDVWVAPAHAFDRNTLTALREHGFTTVSDGFSLNPFTAYGLTWVPQQLWDHIPFRAGVWTICNHHNPWDAKKLERFERDLTAIGERRGTVADAVGGKVHAHSVRDQLFSVAWRAAIFSKRGVVRSMARRLCAPQ